MAMNTYISLYFATLAFVSLTPPTSVLAGPVNVPINSRSPTGSAVVPPVSVSSFTGPVSSLLLADLCILHHEGTYYAYATNSGKDPSNHINVPTAFSKNATGGWQAGPDALKNGVGNWSTDPSGVEAGLWNPDVSQLDDGRFIMYYSVRGKNAPGNERCIGAAYSDTPLGPFEPTDEPWYCPPQAGAIGVSGTKDGNRRFVLFKDGSNKKLGSKIALWEVDSKNGFSKTTKEPAIVLKAPKNQVGYEGPAITKMPNGKYLLLHTTGTWHEDYVIHYAISDTIDGEYKEGGVLLTSGDEGTDGKKVYRPGGPDFVGASNNKFFFFGESSIKSKKRVMYYGELTYRNDEVVTVKWN